MLRNLILIGTKNGILLYSKEFLHGVGKPSMIGGLVTGMLECAIQRTGVPVSYIELTTVGVSIVTNGVPSVTCAVFYDIDDGQEFGQLIAQEFLNAFVATYSSPNEEKISVTGVQDFTGFNMKISETIRNSVRPVLDNLKQVRGIQSALLISGDSITHATVEVDKLNILANIQAFLNVASDVMAAKHDLLYQIILKSDRTSVTLVKILEGTHLVVVSKTNTKHELFEGEIDAAAKLLQKVLVMSSNLQDQWHS